MSYETALTALADPTRRRMYERLRARPQPVGVLARQARISQPAASQHLRVLLDARLVRVEPRGTRRIYHATPDGLAELRRYFESLWGDALSSFRAYAEKENRS